MITIHPIVILILVEIILGAFVVRLANEETGPSDLVNPILILATFVAMLFVLIIYAGIFWW